MTPAEIQKARAIIAAATPGRWIWTYSSINGKISYTLLNSSIQEKHDDWFPTKEDRILIAESRTGWESALNENDQLRIELAATKALNVKYREALEEIEDEPNQIGPRADIAVAEYGIQAWTIAHEALAGEEKESK